MEFLDGEYWLTPDEVTFLEQNFGKSSYFIPEYPLVITVDNWRSNE